MVHKYEVLGSFGSYRNAMPIVLNHRFEILSFSMYYPKKLKESISVRCDFPSSTKLLMKMFMIDLSQIMLWSKYDNLSE